MIATHRRGAFYVLAALALALPASARAESVTPTTTPDSTVAAAAVAGPTVASASVAVRARPDASGEAAAMQQRAGLGRSQALMIVGLATLIAGAVIGGDAGTIIMVAGAGIGLYGLYHYLQ
jgi:hypothetical protein